MSGETSVDRSRLRPRIAVTLTVLTLAAVTLGLLLLRESGAVPVDPAVDVGAIEESYRRLRDAILQDDDETFFLMHSAAAREKAVAEFPEVRARYLSAPEEERQAFRDLFRVTEQEFLEEDPRTLVVRILPWRSGWRGWKEYFRRATVKDTRFEVTPGVDGGPPVTRGVLQLDVPRELLPDPNMVIEQKFLPTVIFVRDSDGWRREAFFR